MSMKTDIQVSKEKLLDFLEKNLDNDFPIQLEIDLDVDQQNDIDVWDCPEKSLNHFPTLLDNHLARSLNTPHEKRISLSLNGTLKNVLQL